MSFSKPPARPDRGVRRGAHAGHRRRRFLGKSRRLGQAALFAAVRGAAYALGAAVGAWFLYWITQR